MTTVNRRQLTTFTTPAGNSALASGVIRANYNTIGSAHNLHDADATIHVQSFANAASLPSPGTAGRLLVDRAASRIYLDDGSTNTTLKVRAEDVLAGTLNLTSLVASGNLTSSSVNAINAGVGNGSRQFLIGVSLGTDGPLGPVSMSMGGMPSADPTLRYGAIEVGDALGVRMLALRASRFYLGTDTTPTFAGGELLAVKGEMAMLNGARALRLGPGVADHTYIEFFPRTAAPNTVGGYIGFGSAASIHTDITNAISTGLVRAITTNGFFQVGNGAASTNVPLSAPSFSGAFSGNGASITGLVTAQIAGLDAALSGKAAVSHEHDASAITSGLLPWARIATPSVGSTGAASGLARPNAGFAAYNLTYIDIGGDRFIPVFTGTSI